jgi:hypothetical protein
MEEVLDAEKQDGQQPDHQRAQRRATFKGVLQAIANKQNEIGQKMIVPDEEKPKPCKYFPSPQTLHIPDS